MMSKINRENKELFATLSENSGVNITNINDIDAFYATLMVEVGVAFHMITNNR